MAERTERYRELLEIKERRTPELIRRSGVVGVGVGRDEIVVYAERGVPVEREIEGRPVRVITTEKISILLKLRERIEEPESVLATEGLTKFEYSPGCFEWASPLYIPKKYHAPFLSPVSGTKIGQEWGILDDENTHSFAGYVVWGKKPDYMEIFHTRYANGDYSIKGYDVLGPGHFNMGGHGGAGIRLKITDGVIEPSRKKDLGKTLGVSETSTWENDWNRFIFDTPIPVKKGQHYLLCFRAKEPMPPLETMEGWDKGYLFSAAKQEGYVARPAFNGRVWKLDFMNIILREWVVSVKGTLCTDCTTEEECKSAGCVWWGKGKVLTKGYWWRYPCHSYPKPCRFYDNIDECADAGCIWTSGGCYKGAPYSPPKIGRHKKWRPAPPGVSISNVKAPGWGTFTAVVLKNGVKKILGCRHVLAYGNVSLNSIIVQPLNAEDRIGVLEYYVPFKAGENEVDCAIANVDNQGDVVPGVLLNDDNYSPSIIPTGVEDAYVGQSVMKSGARTGVRSGTVTSIETDVIVNTELGSRTYTGCIVTGKIGDGGDSGSILLSKESKSLNKAVGMLFAGSDKTTVHIPMKKTLSALGCTLMIQEGPPAPKAYIKTTTSPSGAEIWLKKH